MGARDPPGDPTGGPAPCGLKNRRSFRARFLRLFFLARKHMFYFFDVSTSDLDDVGACK